MGSSHVSQLTDLNGCVQSAQPYILYKSTNILLNSHKIKVVSFEYMFMDPLRLSIMSLELQTHILRWKYFTLGPELFRKSLKIKS